MRETSLDAYKEIQSNGLLDGWQLEVYQVLYKHGPLTQNELHKKYFAHTQPRNIQPRVSELVKMKVVKCVGERPCGITGRSCLIWDVTKGLPWKAGLKVPSLKLKVRLLEGEIARLYKLLRKHGIVVVRKIPD